MALQLQRDAGTEVGRGKTRGSGEPGQYHVVYSFAEESVGVAAGRLAVRIVNHLVQPLKGFDYRNEFEQLVLLAERAAFGPSTQAILDEAGAARHPLDPPQPGSRWCSSATASTRSGSGPP